MHHHRVGGGLGWAIAAVLTAGTLAACASAGDSTQSPAGAVSSPATPRASVGPFEAAALVPAGYQVLSSTAMPLGGAERPDYQVVISAAKAAVEGGTQNVQVFAYDDTAWRHVFSAADAVVP